MATQSLGRELSNREFYIQRWEQEYPGFVGVFKALPANRLQYRPHPRSRSAGELVALLVSAQQSCIQLCKSRKSLYSGLRWQEPASVGSQDEMISIYERDHGSLAIQLHALDDNGWNHQAWLIEGEEEILLKDTVGGLLWIALFDMVHHRGQLSSYIRPMGGKVPSIYGPSADDPGERH
jgi:DinB family